MVGEFQNEEFRSGFLNFALGMSETVEKGRESVRLIDNTPFKDLTPEIWAKIHTGLDALKMCMDVMGQINTIVPNLMDNTKAQEAVEELVQHELDKEVDDG